jgi:hypothetical protein
MSAQLTLLLLCDQHEPYFLFVSALKSAGFQVVIARTAVRAMRFVSTTRVDAILILDSDGGDGDALGRELRRMAPRTPVLLRCEGKRERQPGIDALWQADLQDEAVANAVAAFFRQTLAGPPAEAAGLQGGEKDASAARVGQQPA